MSDFRNSHANGLTYAPVGIGSNMWQGPLKSGLPHGSGIMVGLWGTFTGKMDEGDFYHGYLRRDEAAQFWGYFKEARTILRMEFYGYAKCRVPYVLPDPERRCATEATPDNRTIGWANFEGFVHSFESPRYSGIFSCDDGSRRFTGSATHNRDIELIILFANGSRYEGQTCPRSLGLTPEGFGTIYFNVERRESFSLADRIVNSFKERKQETSWTGSWSEGLRHGPGISTYLNGRQKKTYYLLGEQVSRNTFWNFLSEMKEHKKWSREWNYTLGCTNGFLKPRRYIYRSIYKCDAFFTPPNEAEERQNRDVYIPVKDVGFNNIVG